MSQLCLQLVLLHVLDPDSDTVLTTRPLKHQLLCQGHGGTQALDSFPPLPFLLSLISDEGRKAWENEDRLVVNSTFLGFFTTAFCTFKPLIKRSNRNHRAGRWACWKYNDGGEQKRIPVTVSSPRLLVMASHTRAHTCVPSILVRSGILGPSGTHVLACAAHFACVL